MIEGLVTALGVKLDLTGEEIADVLWLVAHMQEPDQVVEEINQPTQGKQPSADGRDAIADRTELPVVEDKSLKDKAASSTEAEAELYPEEDRQGLNDLSFQVPDARSLREPLELAKALKPLLRRVPSKTLEQGLDEEATVQRIADEHIWAPVLQPALEPWLDLVLVVDESPSMLIWQSTVLELKRILERYGVFRNVSTWSLTPEGDNNLKLCPGLGKIARNQHTHSASELLDPDGRRLVVVASDCVSQIWQQKTVLPLLQLWAENGPLVIAQMLPQWLWNRTALGLATGVEFSGLEPEVPNKRLATRPLSRRRRSRINLREGIKIPVVTLQPEEFSDWTGMLTGKGNTWAKGFVYSPDTHCGAATSPIREVPTNLTAEERVQRFRLTASPMARKLASLLASAPVINLPIVRIVQDSLLKGSRQVHVAEVFLGGVLEQVTEVHSDTKAYNIQFDFFKGVRELLLESVPTSEIKNIFNEVSEFVAENIGLSLDEFVAVLRSPKNIQNQELVSKTSSFAKVAAQILRRLGGEYSTFADELDRKREQRRKTPLSTTDFRAKTLKEAFRSCNLGALTSDALDRYYVDLAAVRGGEAIEGINTVLDFLDPGETTSIFFAGHRGCGKSTELRRIQRHWEQDYRVIYLEVDEETDINSVNYTDLYLIVIKQVEYELRRLGHKVDPRLLANIENWFMDVTGEDERSVESSISLEGEATLGPDAPFLAKLLVKLLAQIKGSDTRKTTIHQTLQRDISRLKADLNLLLNDAYKKIKAKYPKGFLIIFDNLDRIPPAVSDRLFFDYGTQLKDLNCTLVYTVPMSVIHSERNLNILFVHPHIMPMVNVYRLEQDNLHLAYDPDGVTLMTRMIEQRIKVDQVFDSPYLVTKLVELSGGHVRQLMHLTRNACLTANKRGHAKVLAEDIDYAANEERSNFERFIPATHYPVLAEICRTKKRPRDPEKQAMLQTMLFSLTILEYYTGNVWMYVNPLVKQIHAFHEAL
jgi:hypothetical protein